MITITSNRPSFRRRGIGLRLNLACAVGATALSAGAWAQCPTDWLPGEGHPGVSGDGPVSALTTWDPDGVGPQPEVLVAVGGFEGAGDVAARRIATWDGSEWHALGPGDPPGITGQVWTLAVYNGDLIIGGNISAAGGVPVSMIARFDGETWHPLGSGIGPYPVRALAVYNGELYAGGLFTDAGGVSVNGIARWNGSAWQSLGSGLNAGAGVTALTVFDGKLIVGGGFTSAGGVPATRVASWDGTSWQSMDGGIIHASAPDELTVYDGQLIAGMNIFSSGGSFLRSVSRWSGTTWEALGPGNPTPSDVVTELIEYQGDLYAGGVFTSAGGVTTPNRMARWDGSAWFAIPSGPGTPHRAVGAFAVFNGDLIAGGTSTRASGLAESAIGRWDGASWHTMGGGVNFVVIATAEFQGDTYIGGAFTRAGDIDVSSIACRGPDGTWDDLLGGVSGGAEGPIVGSMVVFENSLLASGSFTHAGGVPVNGIARWDGKAWSAFSGEFAGDLFVHDGELFGMIAPSIPGTSQVAKWNPLTESWQPLGSLPSGAVILCLAVFNGDLIAAGAGFGSAPAAVYRWDGAIWHPMGGTFGLNAIQALAVYNGELIAGGVYDGSSGPPGGIIRWNPGASSWTTFQGGLFDDDTENFTYGVWDMVVRNNELIIAGVFSHLGTPFGVEGDNIARWNGSSWAGLGEGTNDHIVDLAQGNSVLILGGWFTMAGGTPNGHFARWGSLCPLGDITGDGVVNIDDLLALIAAWGPCSAPPIACPGDFDLDGAVEIDDLLLLIGNWG